MLCKGWCVLQWVVTALPVTPLPVIALHAMLRRQCRSADARLAELLQGRTRGPKKSVRWPDQMDEGDDDGVDAFRIGRPRQLEIVHWVEGLGPPPGSMRAGAADSAPSMATAVQPQPGGSFADAVRAEHRVERSLLHMDDS